MGRRFLARGAEPLDPTADRRREAPDGAPVACGVGDHRPDRGFPSHGRSIPRGCRPWLRTGAACAAFATADSDTGFTHPPDTPAGASDVPEILLLLRNTDDLAATIAVMARPHRKIVGATRLGSSANALSSRS